MRTPDELSIILSEQRLPSAPEALSALRVERGFAVASVAGPLDFAIVGLLARIAAALAEARVPVVAVGSFDTDHLLVRIDAVARATSALRRAGFEVE
ncbi:MAG TPA: ACT domain-containing protein [Phycisphaerales bacterium]|nr:ACT domain-containing protein [Phycisphaerales bacterium]HMP37422.1 ACT domain-containing protein [Phycisphaerales bacterium]